MASPILRGSLQIIVLVHVHPYFSLHATTYWNMTVLSVCVWKEEKLLTSIKQKGLFFKLISVLSATNNCNFFFRQKDSLIWLHIPLRLQVGKFLEVNWHVSGHLYRNCIMLGALQHQHTKIVFHKVLHHLEIHVCQITWKVVILSCIYLAKQFTWQKQETFSQNYEQKGILLKLGMMWRLKMSGKNKGNVPQLCKTSQHVSHL